MGRGIRRAAVTSGGGGNRIAGGAVAADSAVPLDPLDRAITVSIGLVGAGLELITATVPAKDIASVAAIPTKIGTFPANSASEPCDIGTGSSFVVQAAV